MDRSVRTTTLNSIYTKEEKELLLKILQCNCKTDSSVAPAHYILIKIELGKDKDISETLNCGYVWSYLIDDIEGYCNQIGKIIKDKLIQDAKNQSILANN
jgi:hypothetical protein